MEAYQENNHTADRKTFETPASMTLVSAPMILRFAAGAHFESQNGEFIRKACAPASHGVLGGVHTHQ
jgi:hypothetical protein